MDFLPQPHSGDAGQQSSTEEDGSGSSGEAGIGSICCTCADDVLDNVILTVHSTLPLCKVVPLQASYALIFLLSLFHGTLVILGGMHSILIVSAFMPAIIIGLEFVQGFRTHEGFLDTWMIYLSVYFAESHQGANFLPKQYSWPTFLNWSWIVAFLVHNLWFPRTRPKTLHHVAACVAYLVSAAIVTYLASGAAHPLGGALWGGLQYQPLIMLELRYFLESCDQHGCRALLVLPLLQAPYHCMEERYQTIFVLLVIQLIFIHVGTRNPLHQVHSSTSPMYVDQRYEDAHKSCVRRAHLWLRTWRGKNYKFLLNAILAIVAFAASRGVATNWVDGHKGSNTLIASQDPEVHSDLHDLAKMAKSMFWILISISTVCIVLCILNLAHDGWIDARKLPVGFCGSLVLPPMDRHFHVLTAMKGMLCWLKITIVFYSVKMDKPLASMLLQIFSIAATMFLSCNSVLSLYSVAHQNVAKIQDSFSSPRVLFFSVILSLLILQTFNASILVCDVVLNSQYVKTTDVITFVGVYNVFSLPILLLGNELVLVLASKTTRPRVFDSCHSPRGVKALVTFCAARFLMYVIFVLCRRLYESAEFTREGTYFSAAMFCLAGLAIIQYAACGKFEAVFKQVHYEDEDEELPDDNRKDDRSSTWCGIFDCCQQDNRSF